MVITMSTQDIERGEKMAKREEVNKKFINMYAWGIPETEQSIVRKITKLK